MHVQRKSSHTKIQKLEKYLSEVQLNKINKYKNIHAEINAEQEAQLLQTDCIMAGWPRIQ